MNTAWSTRRIAEVLKVKFLAEDRPLSLITTDSRKVIPGSAFVAIQGDVHDGHQFIDQAIDQGAALVLSEKSSTRAEVIQVSSTLNAMRELAHAYRKEFKVPIIAVVGAVGKTTTKELASSLLSGKFKHVHKTEGSQNGFLGIPITLLDMDSQTEIAIIEVGIDDIGAMDQHLALVEPTHVILTKNGPEHLHQLKTIEIAASEELRALDYAQTHELPAALNLSDEYVLAWLKKHESNLIPARIKSYSLEKARVPDYLGFYDVDSGELRVQNENLNACFHPPLPGEHHAHNLLAAITLTQFFGLTVEELRRGLANFKTAYGRTEILKLDQSIDVIGDYYNSNPTSLEAALKLLSARKNKPSYHAVLGDMLELGDGEEIFHRQIANQLHDQKITHAWLIGPRMRWLKEELTKHASIHAEHFESADQLTARLKLALTPSSQVLIKGSRGMRMEKILKSLQERN